MFKNLKLLGFVLAGLAVFFPPNLLMINNNLNTPFQLTAYLMEELGVNTSDASSKGKAKVEEGKDLKGLGDAKSLSPLTGKQRAKKILKACGRKGLNILGIYYCCRLVNPLIEGLDRIDDPLTSGWKNLLHRCGIFKLHKFTKPSDIVIPWAAIGNYKDGSQQDIKSILERRIIIPIKGTDDSRHVLPEVGIKPILFSGTAGVGKTQLVLSLAERLGVRPLIISQADFTSQDGGFDHNPAAMLRDLIDAILLEARSARGFVVVIFDEIDKLLQQNQALAGQLNMLLDGVESSQEIRRKILFVATSNAPLPIDLSTRFQIFQLLPDRDVIFQALSNWAGDRLDSLGRGAVLEVAAKVSEDSIAHLAQLRLNPEQIHSKATFLRWVSEAKRYDASLFTSNSEQRAQLTMNRLVDALRANGPWRE